MVTPTAHVPRRRSSRGTRRVSQASPSEQFFTRAKRVSTGNVTGNVAEQAETAFIDAEPTTNTGKRERVSTGSNTDVQPQRKRSVTVSFLEELGVFDNPMDDEKKPEDGRGHTVLNSSTDLFITHANWEDCTLASDSLAHADGSVPHDVSVGSLNNDGVGTECVDVEIDGNDSIGRQDYELELAYLREVQWLDTAELDLQSMRMGVGCDSDTLDHASSSGRGTGDSSNGGDLLNSTPISIDTSDASLFGSLPINNVHLVSIAFYF